MRGCWSKLKCWQKGALLGGGGHLVMAAAILIAYFIAAIIDKSGKGNGDMSLFTLIMWILFHLFWLLELIPFSILYIIGSVKYLPFPDDPLSTSWTGWTWFALYLTYATAIYILLGMALCKVIGFSKGVRKGTKQ